MAQVSMIGTGYVGLVTGAVMAQKGHQVLCCDIDESKIAALENGDIPFFEPGLDQMLARCRSAGRLHFTTSVQEAVEHGKFVFIAVGTPADPVTGRADLSAVLGVAREIATHMREYRIIVVKSTVPVGTAERVAEAIRGNLHDGVGFDVASNPEFLREGAAIEDALEPIRVVIGAPNNDVARSLIEIYAPFEAPMIVTSPQAAELCKYACNVFLATKLSFVNLVAMLCEKTGADIKEVTRGMGCDPRIGSRFLGAGLGFGGSCFPKDVIAFVNTLRDHGCPDEMVQATLDINEAMPRLLVDKIRARLGGLQGKRLAFWGLAFKPQSDDMRQSRAVELARALLAEGASVCAHDPQAMENARRIMPQIDYCDDVYEVCRDADAVVLVTEWPEYQHLDLQHVAAVLHTPLLFDGRNLLDPEAVKLAGLEYYGLGRTIET